MVNAVVLAGGKDKTTFIDVLGWILFQVPYFIVYHKIKLPGSYKCFMKVGGKIEGVYKKRPSMEYLLQSLDNCSLIDRVAIVTNRKKFKEKLDINIKNYTKKFIIVEQVGSLKENALAGYYALDKKGHTLFIAGDSPLTTAESIQEFYEKCEPYMNYYGIFFPLVSKEVHHIYDKDINRKYFDVEDDLTGNKKEFIDKYGRRKFRITSMGLANLEEIGNKNAIDFLYEIRNIALPQNIIKAYKTFRTEIWKAVKFRGKDKLKLSDLEKKMSLLLQARSKFIELQDAKSSLDLDDVGDDKRIERINGYYKHINQQ